MAGRGSRHALGGLRAGRWVSVRARRAGRARQADVHGARGRGAQQALGRAADAQRGAQASGRRGAGARGERGRGVAGARPQAGPAGPGWIFVHSDSVFGPGSTRYFFLSH